MAIECSPVGLRRFRFGLWDRRSLNVIDTRAGPCRRAAISARFSDELNGLFRRPIFGCLCRLLRG